MKMPDRSVADPIQFRNAVRLQTSLSAGIEKRTLDWLAHRTPAWINSDHLTVVGFTAQFLAAVGYAAARWNKYALVAVIFCLALNWLGDSLDGTLARVRHRQRPRYGFYVDHIVDTFSALFLMSGLAASGYIHPAIAFGMLIAFLMLSIESYLAAYTLAKFHLSHWKFGPTEIRILLGLGNLALLRFPTVHLLDRSFRLFDLGGAIAIGGMSLMLFVAAAQHTRALYMAERI